MNFNTSLPTETGMNAVQFTYLAVLEDVITIRHIERRESLL